MRRCNDRVSPATTGAPGEETMHCVGTTACGAVLLAAMGFGLWTYAAAAEGAGGAPPASCAEDGSADAPPTYSVRFDPKDNDSEGSAFARARARATRYCAQQACTIDGHSAARVPSVYGVGSVVRGRLIVGFSCVPAAAGGERPAPASYQLGQPSDIDAALAKAREHCGPGHAKAELTDLLMADGKLVAVFSCGL
jgi:hypothetical protein